MKLKWNVVPTTNVRIDGQTSWNILVDIVVKGQEEISYSRRTPWLALLPLKPSRNYHLPRHPKYNHLLEESEDSIIQILNHLKDLLDVFTNSRKTDRWYSIVLHVLHHGSIQNKLCRCWNGIFSLYTIYICHKIPQEICNALTMMIGLVIFSNEALSPPWLFHHGIDSLEQLGHDHHAPQSPRRNPMPISSAEFSISYWLGTSGKFFQRGHESSIFLLR